MYWREDRVFLLQVFSSRIRGEMMMDTELTEAVMKAPSVFVDLLICFALFRLALHGQIVTL